MFRWIVPAAVLLVSISMTNCVTVPKSKSVTHLMRSNNLKKYSDARETMYGTDKNGYSDLRRRARAGQTR